MVARGKGIVKTGRHRDFLYFHCKAFVHLTSPILNYGSLHQITETKPPYKNIYPKKTLSLKKMLPVLRVWLLCSEQHHNVYVFS